MACPARTPPRPRPTTCTLRWDRSPRSRARAPRDLAPRRSSRASPPAPPQSWSSSWRGSGWIPATSPRTYRVVARSASRRRPPSPRSPPPRPPAPPTRPRPRPVRRLGALRARVQRPHPVQAQLPRAVRNLHQQRHPRLLLQVPEGHVEARHREPERRQTLRRRPPIQQPRRGKLCTHVLPFVGDESLKDVGPPEADRFVDSSARSGANPLRRPRRGNAGTLESTGGGQGRRDVLRARDGETHNLISAAVTDGQLSSSRQRRKREAVAAGRSQSEGHRRVLLRAPVNTRRHHESA